jgi:hypothetical protein
MAGDSSSKDLDESIWNEVELNNKEAKKILLEAYIIARWAKKPFYIT